MAVKFMYVCRFNIKTGNTFNSEDFDLMIYSAIKKREELIVSKNKMEIKLHPRIAQAVHDSSFISSIILLLIIFNS